jgi:hypothetical protein
VALLALPGFLARAGLLVCRKRLSVGGHTLGCGGPLLSCLLGLSTQDIKNAGGFICREGQGGRWCRGGCRAWLQGIRGTWLTGVACAQDWGHGASETVLPFGFAFFLSIQRTQQPPGTVLPWGWGMKATVFVGLPFGASLACFVSPVLVFPSASFLSPPGKIPRVVLQGMG